MVESVEEQDEQDRDPAQGIQFRHYWPDQFFRGLPRSKTHFRAPNVAARAFVCQLSMTLVMRSSNLQSSREGSVLKITLALLSRHRWRRHQDHLRCGG